MWSLVLFFPHLWFLLYTRVFTTPGAAAPLPSGALSKPLTVSQCPLPNDTVSLSHLLQKTVGQSNKITHMKMPHKLRSKLKASCLSAGRAKTHRKKGRYTGFAINSAPFLLQNLLLQSHKHVTL